jgi:hypothetical protein
VLLGAGCASDIADAPLEGGDAGTDPSLLAMADRPRNPHDPAFDGLLPNPARPGFDGIELPGSERPDRGELPDLDPTPGTDLPGEYPEEPPPFVESDEYGCTFSQGYWKNHPELWPVPGLTLGSHYYTAAELLAVLSTEPQGDASISLAYQLIAALLNMASGASWWTPIQDAQAWMSDEGTVLPYGIESSSAAGMTAAALTMTLGSYNEGLAGPGHCNGGVVYEEPR